MKQTYKVTLAAIVAGFASVLMATGTALYLVSDSPTEEQIVMKFKNEAQPSIDRGTNALAKMNRDQLRRNHSELEQLKQRVNNLSVEDPIDESMPDPTEGISPEEAKAADLAR